MKLSQPGVLRCNRAICCGAGSPGHSGQRRWRQEPRTRWGSHVWSWPGPEDPTTGPTSTWDAEELWMMLCGSGNPSISPKPQRHLCPIPLLLFTQNTSRKKRETGRRLKYLFQRETWHSYTCYFNYCNSHVINCFSSVHVTLWTVACQAPLSMGFSRQEYWSGLLCPSARDLPNPGIEPESPASPALQVDSSPT